MPLEWHWETPWQGKMRADDLTIPWEKHFTDLLMAVLDRPHGFSIQLAAALQDRKLVIYVQTSHEGMMYNRSIHLVVPPGQLRGAPNLQFCKYVQEKVDAMAETMRHEFCEFYKAK